MAGSPLAGSGGVPSPPDGLLIVLSARRGTAYFDPRDGHFYRYNATYSSYVCYNEHVRVHCNIICPSEGGVPCASHVGAAHDHPPLTREEVECLYIRWRATLFLIQSPFQEGGSSAIRRVVNDHPREWALDVSNPDVMVRSWKSYISTVRKGSKDRHPSIVRLVRNTGLEPCAAFLQAFLQERDYYCPLPPLRPVGMLLLLLLSSFSSLMCWLGLTYFLFFSYRTLCPSSGCRRARSRVSSSWCGDRRLFVIVRSRCSCVRSRFFCPFPDARPGPTFGCH